MENEETTLWAVVDTARRQWRLIVVVTLSLLVGATLYAERQPTQYEASAIVAVVPRIEQSSADMVRVAAPRFAAYITAPATVARVAGRLGEDPVRLQEQVDAVLVPDTGNITITVRHLDPRRAVNAANDLAGQLRRASAPDRLVMAQLVAPAVLPASPAGPPRRLIEAAALVVGLLLSVGLAALVTAVHRRPARAQPPGDPATAVVAAARRPAVAALPAPPSPLQAPAAAAIAALSELGRYPVVGELPWSPAVPASAEGGQLDPAVEQAIRTLTANLARPLGRGVRGAIVVTSPDPLQGRTTVARLLAASRLRSRARVLRVDGHKEHAQVLRPGQDSDDGPPSDAADHDPSAGAGRNWVKDLWVLEDGMWVLPEASDSMREALAEGREAELLEEAREMFDCVVVDAPAILADDESQSSLARTLIPLADAVLFVVSPDSRVESLSRSIEAFREVRGPFVGVVLNRARPATAPGGSSNGHRLEAPALPGGRR